MADATARTPALPCVWVLAGVLSYRLCDRDYRCDECELHHALQGHPLEHAALAAPESPRTDADQRVSGYLCRFLEGCTLHLDRPYSTSHFWIAPASEDDVLLGLDDYILRVLEPIDEIVSPGIGAWLARDQPCGWVRRGHAAIPLRMPLAGELTAVNTAFAARRESPAACDDRWLFRVTPHERLDTVPGLYRGAQALSWHLEKLRQLGRYLREALAREPAPYVGTTLADGGVPERNLEAVIGRKAYGALVETLFAIQI